MKTMKNSTKNDIMKVSNFQETNKRQGTLSDLYLKDIPEQITSIDQLFGTLPSDIDLEDVRAERM